MAEAERTLRSAVEDCVGDGSDVTCFWFVGCFFFQQQSLEAGRGIRQISLSFENAIQTNLFLVQGEGAGEMPLDARELEDDVAEVCDAISRRYVGVNIRGRGLRVLTLLFFRFAFGAGGLPVERRLRLRISKGS